jgi:hypothetical protein
MSNELLFLWEAGGYLLFRKLATKGIDVSCSLMLILWEMRWVLVDAKACLAGASTGLNCGGAGGLNLI